MNRADHWDTAYAARREEELTWYEERPTLSLDLVTAHLRRGAPFIDVGGGAARLVDCLLAEGYGPLTVLDVSPSIIAAGRARLGDRVDWIVADITRWKPDRAYSVWHDRAVFHFLTDDADRAAYVETLIAGLAPGGCAIIGTFDENGPEMCSGLPVTRYAPADLAGLIGNLAPGTFETLEVRRHRHITPRGGIQSFQFSTFRKLPE